MGRSIELDGEFLTLGQILREFPPDAQVCIERGEDGMSHVHRAVYQDGYLVLFVDACERCGGGGLVDPGDWCPECGGDGHVSRGRGSDDGVNPDPIGYERYEDDRSHEFEPFDDEPLYCLLCGGEKGAAVHGADDADA